MPQFFGDTPSTTTQMCSRAAPLDAASASVRLSMIFGTDSSVTRASYSLTSISGILTHSLSLLRDCGQVPVLHDLVRLCLRFAPPPSESHVDRYRGPRGSSRDRARQHIVSIWFERFAPTCKSE